MRSIWQAAVVAALVLATSMVAGAQPQVTARGAIIVDAETGATIWELNADQPLPPASTTKVMTAVLALQSHRLDHQFEVSSRAAATPPSKIGLRPGQRVSLRDLLFAVLLKSANDAAVVVAEGVSGSEYAFAQQMNLKARVVGAMTTNFENPHGLTEGGHLVSARDLSRIFRYGLGVPGFREVLHTSAAGVEIDGPSGRYTTVRSHNRLLNAPDYQVIGKTGYTRAARRCFVGAAGYGSREIVIALLGSTDLWGDARRMLYYGLSPGRPTPVLTAARVAPPPPAAPVPVAPRQEEYRAEYRAAPPAAEYRMPPQPELRAAPPGRAVPPPPPTPVETARTDISAAPQAAVDRANRMARAQPDAAPADTGYEAAAAAPTYAAPPPDAPAAGAVEAPSRPYAAAGTGAAAYGALDDEPAMRAAPDDEPAPRARSRTTSGRSAPPSSRGRAEVASRSAATSAARAPEPRGRSAAKTTERAKPAPADRVTTRGGRAARKDDKRRPAEVARGTPLETRPGRRGEPREPEPRGASRGKTAAAGRTATAKQSADARAAGQKEPAKKIAGKDADKTAKTAKTAKSARVSDQRPTTAKKR